MLYTKQTEMGNFPSGRKVSYNEGSHAAPDLKFELWLVGLNVKSSKVSNCCG